MDVEIVEFYPFKKDGNSFSGSLHVYIIDLKLDLRGVFVSYNPSKPKKWRFSLPSKKVTDFDTKEVHRYPVINFTDRDINLNLLHQIRYRGKAYIQEKFLGIPNTQPKPVRKNEHQKKFIRKPEKQLWDKKYIR
jgi:hypothetical protein